MTLVRCLTLMAMAAAGLAACTTFDGTINNPIERSLTWFSFVAGDDIRSTCSADSPNRYRFVYNAVYERQIQAYELRMTTGGAELEARARNRAGNVANFQFRNPLGPWELRRADATLSPADAARIVEALDRDIASAPAAVGKRLRSNKFYWTVAACRSGRFVLYAFEQDRVDIEALAFVGPLLVHDRTDVRFADAEQIEGFSDNAFEIRINATGEGIVGGL